MSKTMTVICVSRRQAEAGSYLIPGGEWTSCVDCGREIYMTPNTVRTQREKRAAGEGFEMVCYGCVPPEEWAAILENPRAKALPGALEEAALHVAIARKMDESGADAGGAGQAVAGPAGDDP